MNEYTYSDIQPGLSESFSVHITTDMEDSFRTITGDENPLHKSDDFACSVGSFASHVSFGMLTASFYSTLAGMYIPGKYSLIHSFEDLKFLKPVYAGDMLTVTGTVEEKNDALKVIVVKALIKNQRSEKVSSAKIKIIVLV
ncbi:MAG: MaoC family dehydratase N-terminal domain-containing protein [Treponema sp.]|nr:MaoC family dehydratase N-terminal domain-containing protein [Treponema sp.]